ncbi:MAG: polysaccharide deacetylase family protein [Nanoarchaeota archaeon]
MKTILLTFDVEEFDYPGEKGIGISDNEMYKISYKGLVNILRLLGKHKLKATFFVTASFAKRYPKLIKNMARKHEIASHGYIHKHEYNNMSEKEAGLYLKKSKEILEKITKKKIYGFRAPRFSRPDIFAIKESKFKYDSSINPTYIPGKYNNFFSKRKLHKENGLVIIPASVTPLIRLPLFWIAFRNLGLGYGKLCTKLCFLMDDYVNLLFHPWEFVDVSKLKKLGLAVRGTGNRLVSILDDYIIWAKRNKYKFNTINNHLINKGFY